MNRKTWALITAKMGIGLGALLLIETVWWFWPPLGILHQVVMLISGTFSIAWVLLYFTLED